MNAKSRRIRYNKRNNYNRMYFCGEVLISKRHKDKSKKMKQKSRIIANWFRNATKQYIAENLKYLTEGN